MADHSEEQPAQQFDLSQYTDLVRRRHLVFLLLLLCAWLAVWGSSWVLAPRYKSSTLILVEQPTMPPNYVVPNVNEDLQERLQSITQQILSRTRLLLIIDKLHLYQQKRQTLTPDEKVDKMRSDIGIDLVRDPQNQAITAFRVSYLAPDPQVAQDVTSELTNLFINENLQVREQESEHTTQFIESQLAKARASLADQDAKVRTFQAAHEGELPSQEASNLQILAGLQAQLQNEQDALNTSKQQGVYDQSLVEQYRLLQGTDRTPDGAPTGLTAIDQQLQTLRSRLADLSTRYTDRYPEIQMLKSEIAKAEKTRDELLARLTKGDGQKNQNKLENVQDPAQNAPLLQLQSQLQANQIEIANREQAVTSLKARIGQYQARLSAEPARQQELADLTRGYDQLKTDYDDLLKKESDSQMATSMEQMQEGERFTVLDPPSLPLKPDFPNRLKMCGAGLGIGLAVAVLGVAGLELFDDRLHTDKAIRMLLPVDVISEIPEIVSPLDERRGRRRLWRGWAVAVVVLVIITAGSVFSYLHA